MLAFTCPRCDDLVFFDSAGLCPSCAMTRTHPADDDPAGLAGCAAVASSPRADTSDFGELVLAWLPCRVADGSTVDRVAS